MATESPQLLSIIVPVYNKAQYISDTLASLSGQTYKHVEIIVVNDGSTDNTLEVLQQCAAQDPRIQLINQPNSGVSAARLKGITAARGDWIGFCDGDDYVEPNLYEHLLNNAAKYQAEISHCGYRSIVGDTIDDHFNTQKLAVQNHQQGLYDLISGQFIEPSLCTKIFHKTLFAGDILSQKIDLSIKNTEDFLMNFYLFKNAKQAVYEDFCGYHYIQRANSATTQALNIHQLTDSLKVFDQVAREIAAEPILTQALQGRIWSNLIGLATLDSNSNFEFVYQVRAQARNRMRKNWRKTLKNPWALKFKLQILLTTFAPGIYSFIHRFYEVVIGRRKWKKLF